jgi:hypothetical protein
LSTVSTAPVIEDFAVTFSSAVHDGLDKVLGRGATEAILDHVKETTYLPDPAEFHKALVELFGLSGTLSLERAIVQDLTTRLKWSRNLSDVGSSKDFNATIRALEKGTR